MQKTPFQTSQLALFLSRRILELRPHKSQKEIALAAGFTNANFVAMLKRGDAKLPLDRVPLMAAALECDVAFLLRLALEQAGLETTNATIQQVLGTVVSANEREWLEEIRDASGHSDPRLTFRLRGPLRALLGNK